MWMPLLALTALALMPAAYGQGECAEGFTLLGASCYAVVGERVPLAAARASCEELDSELVAIETKQEFINIKSWLSGEVAAHNPKPAFDLWVNAVCQESNARNYLQGACSGGFHWPSGEELAAGLWAKGRPRNGRVPPDGVVLWRNAQWHLDNRPSIYKKGIALCEKAYDADDCANVTCQNGGSCVDALHSYTCVCQGTYEGEHCEINTDDCVEKPCKNGAICVDGDNAYKCICRAGWEGETCENNIDDCADSPCLNEGRCRDGIASYTCACHVGFEGDRCEINVDDCSPNPCQNGGRCEDGANSFICTCVDHYSGTHCEIGCNGGNSCCHGGICGENEGDCDNNEDCKPGLVCGTNNCKGSTFQSTDDCCEKLDCDGDNSCCANGMCGENEGDCDTNRDCAPGLVCGINNCKGSTFQSGDDCCAEVAGCDGGDSCCARGICGVGEGDCDSNADCQDGLVCGTNNCRGRTFQSTDDCCEEQTTRCDGGNSCCSGGNCAEGEGDCDKDSDCMAGLVCGTNNCKGDTYQSTDDCCEPSNCTGGNSCCNGDCGVGEGDCDYHSDCLPGLACGTNNCKGDTFQSTDDCCYQP